MKNLLKIILVGGVITAGYYGVKNKDPKLLGLAIGKLLVLGFFNNRN